MSDEADSVAVRDDDFGRGRVLASITHGQYVTSMNMTRGEAARLRDALAEYLESTVRHPGPFACGVCGRGYPHTHESSDL